MSKSQLQIRFHITQANLDRLDRMRGQDLPHEITGPLLTRQAVLDIHDDAFDETPIKRVVAGAIRPGLDGARALDVPDEIRCLPAHRRQPSRPPLSQDRITSLQLGRSVWVCRIAFELALQADELGSVRILTAAGVVQIVGEYEPRHVIAG